MPIKDVYQLLFDRTPCPWLVSWSESDADEWRKNSVVLALLTKATPQEVDAALGEGTALECKKFFRVDLYPETT